MVQFFIPSAKIEMRLIVSVLTLVASTVWANGIKSLTPPVAYMTEMDAFIMLSSFVRFFILISSGVVYMLVDDVDVDLLRASSTYATEAL